MNLLRIEKHLVTTHWSIRRAFPPRTLRAIEEATREAELGHHAQIRFAVEAALDSWRLMHGETPHERAIEVFSLLRVWDTEHNNGVLIYLLLADRTVEIVADRGISRHVKSAEWEKICHEMQNAFHAGRFEEGAVQGVKAVGDLLTRHFPDPEAKANEMTNRPAVL